MELDEVKEALKKFVLRVSSYGRNRTPEEIRILPEIAELVLSYSVDGSNSLEDAKT